MPFPESVKLGVQRAAHFHCCLCRELGVEVHHIVPQAEGGSDELANAAPLCPSCHETYGANPVKRKFIREARDFWYEICVTRYAGDRASLDEIRTRLESMATKVDIQNLIVNAPGRSEIVPWDALKYSFDRDEFVHPLIVQELLGWISDPGSSIVAVDISRANRSNRFYGKYSVNMPMPDKGSPTIIWNGDDQDLEFLRKERQWFSYRLVAISPSGVHMVECRDCGGGVGVYGTIALIVFERDNCLQSGSTDSLLVSNRIVIKILGAIHFGDRYAGEIVYRNCQLVIGPDQGRLKSRPDSEIERVIEIR